MRETPHWLKIENKPYVFDGALGIASYNVPFIYMYFKFYKTIYNVNLSLKQIPILRTLILL